MMKKFLLLILVIILLCGCFNKKEKKEKKKITTEKNEIVEDIPLYQDENNTPIAFYRLTGNKLIRVDSIYGNYHVLDDIDLLQVYPSNEQEIVLNTSFASSYYDTWNNYYSKKPIKVGFSIKGKLSDQTAFSYQVLTPNDTLAKADFFMAYLYDDYVNQGRSFYSHIEPNQYTDTTLFTAIKLQCGGFCMEITSPVELSVFTYDSEDDFVDGVYRGNSYYTIPICMHGDC